MNTETLKALKASIAKYRRAAGEPEHKLLKRQFAGHECRLCRLYYTDDRANEDLCCGCPVNEAGYPECVCTPWDCADPSLAGVPDLNLRHLVIWLQDTRNELHEKGVEHLRLRCRQEADFLESLLPPKK